MKVKRILSMALCAAIAASMAGCSKETAGGDVTTITVWTGNGGDKAFITKEIENWNNTTGKEKGIRIDYTVQEGSIGEKLDLAFSSGKAPDIFQGGTLAQLVANDQIAAYEDLPGGDALVKKFEKYIEEDMNRINGKTYMLPVSVTTYGLIYNKDMFKAAGIVDENGEAKPPETLAEMVEDAKKLTNPDKKEYGMIFPVKFGSWYDLDVTKVATATDGLPVGYNPATGQFDFSGQAEVMKAIMQIKADGSYFPGADGIDNDTARSRFALGGIGMKTAGSYDYGVLTDQFPAKIDWGVAPFPSADRNEKHLQFMNSGSFYKINKSSVETIGAEKLMTVMEWFCSDELIKKYYENGLQLPIDFDMVSDVELGDDMENWKAFAEMTKISRQFVMPRLFDVSGQKDLAQTWLEDIWTGNIPADQIDEVCREKADMMNKGIEKYQELHPDYDGQKYILPEWNTKR